MTAFTVSNGVVYADGVAIMPKLAYFEDQGHTVFTTINSFINDRADGTSLPAMRYNMAFCKSHTVNANQTALYDLLASKSMWMIGEMAGPAGSGVDYPTFMTAYKDKAGFAGYVANYTRNENYKTPTGYANGAVYPYFDDLGNPQCRQSANKGYRNGRDAYIKYGPEIAPAPPTRGGVNTQANGSQKNAQNALYAHHNTQFFIGTNKLTFATTYRWVDASGTQSDFTEDNTTNNPKIGYNGYKVPWGVIGYQVYGIERTRSTGDYLYYYPRPYAGMRALVLNNVVNGQIITCPMAILGFYQLDISNSDPWGMPTATEVRNQIYQALCGGAKALGYYTYASTWTGTWSSLATVSPDRRLEIGFCHEELSLRAITSSGQRDGETYEKHVLLGVHTMHTVAGNPAIAVTGTVEGTAAEPWVVCASWTLGTTKWIVIVNRHPTNTYTNMTIPLAQGITPTGTKHAGANYDLRFAGLARKTPSGTYTLSTDGLTLNLSTIAGNEVVVLQASTVAPGGTSVTTSTRSTLCVKSTNLATANTDMVTILGDATDNVTFSSSKAKAFTVTDRGKLDSWAGTTAYALNKQIQSSAGRWYVAEVAGTSSGTEPTHAAGTAIDGTVTWRYLGTVTTSTYYYADAQITSAQAALLDAKSYLTNYHNERKYGGVLTGSTSTYARTRAAEVFSFETGIKNDIAHKEFLPSAYGTVLGYYDFGSMANCFTSSGSTTVSGDKVDKVTALSGSALGDARQTTDANRPVIQGKQLNKRAVLAYIGVDNNLKMNFPSGRAAIKNLSGVTLVTVFKLSTLGVNHRLFTCNVNDADLGRCLMFVETTNKLVIGGRRTTSAEAFTSITGATTLVADTWYVAMATFNYSTQAGQIWLNNVSDVTGNICASAGTLANTDTFSDPLIGRDAAGSFDFQGYMACFGVFNGVLAAQELTALYHYYKSIYGL
jgi:hypothetical protein